MTQSQHYRPSGMIRKSAKATRNGPAHTTYSGPVADRGTNLFYAQMPESRRTEDEDQYYHTETESAKKDGSRGGSVLMSPEQYFEKDERRRKELTSSQMPYELVSQSPGSGLRSRFDNYMEPRS